MKINRHHLTEDKSCREFQIKPQNPNDLVLLGEVISPEPFEHVYRSRKNSEDLEITQLNLKRYESNLERLTTLTKVKVRTFYNKILIRRTGKFKRTWDIIIELVLGYNVITTLFFLAYEYPGDVMFIIDLMCWVLFIFEILLNFWTERLNEKNERVKDFIGILRIYSKSWLILDIIAIIPLRRFGYEKVEYMLRMVRLLKLPGVIDITDGTGISYLLSFFAIGKREKSGQITYSYTVKIVVSIVKIFIFLIFIVYFLGCLWYWFQKIVSNYKFSNNSTVLDESTFYQAFNLESLPAKDVALRSSYFMLTTIATIGYGDFLPKNIYEMSFILLVMLFGVTLFAVIMGNFNSAIAYYSESTTPADYLGELNLWLGSLERIHGKINKPLKSKIIDHFKYYFEKDRLKSLSKNYWEANFPDELIIIDQEYVKFLNEQVYYSIIKNLYSDFIHSFKYFLGASKFKFSIIPHLQPRKFMTHDTLLILNEKPSELLFIVSGNVSIGVNIDKKHETLFVCNDGKTIVGDYSILTKTISKYEYLALSFIDALAIESETFLVILNDYYVEHRAKLLGLALKREKSLQKMTEAMLNKFQSAGNSPTKATNVLPCVVNNESDKKIDQAEAGSIVDSCLEIGEKIMGKGNGVLENIKGYKKNRRKFLSSLSLK